MVNSMQANEAPQERMSAAWRLHKRGYEPRRGSVMVKTIDATTTDRLRRSPLYLGLSPSCARKRACMELTTISRFQRLQASTKYLLHSLFYCFSVPSKYCAPTGLWARRLAFDYIPNACPYQGGWNTNWKRKRKILVDTLTRFPWKLWNYFGISLASDTLFW